MVDRTTCVVIGGGPAGMMLGLLLARAGVEVTVLEKHGDFLRDFRGDTVHPSTMQLLDELGLGERFATLPQSTLHEVAIPIDADHRVVVGDLRRLNVAHPYIAMVPQWDLLTLLAEAGAQEPCYSLRMRTEVTELIRDSGRVRGVRYRTEDGVSGEIRAEVTVACDGRWSIAHQQPDLRPKEYPVPLDTWWCRLPGKPAHELSALEPVAGKGRFELIIPREDFLQLAYIAKKGIDPELRARGIESFRRDLTELLPDLADQIGALASMDDVKHLDVRLNRLARWSVDGLLCIGDAGARDVAHGWCRHQPRRTGPCGRRDPARRTFVVPMVEGRRAGPPKPVLAFLRRVPQASFIPAYLIGVGLRPEHAPEFARRPPPYP